MIRLSRLGTASALLVSIGVACGARTGLPVPVCMGQPLKRIDGPNLYFILDRSGSMNETPDDAGPTKWTFVRSDIADLITDLGSEAQFGAAEFPPIGTTCSPGTEVMALRAGDGLPPSAAGSTASIFLSSTSAPPSGGTPTADTFNALAPELRSLNGHTFAILATDGGPNCNPDLTCGVGTCTANIDKLKCFPNPDDPAGPALVCPEPSPTSANCCVRGLCAGTSNCLDAARAVAAVYALAHPLQGNGVPTFVIGVNGSTPYEETLDALAVAGGTARSGPQAYYPVSDPTSLAGALADIAVRIALSCSIELEQAPPDPDQVNVILDGRPVPQGGANGWTLEGGVVTLLGASCDQVHGGHGAVVTSGCPTVKSPGDASSD